ncbi:thioredoxin [Acholeplasma sp. OttesenSCG-928-E16]|nr:thioredoxin [Acholeplasma sp. OttesenSCG-928-E16]
MIKELNEKNFKEAVEKSKIAVVDFWAPWCGPCRAFGPILEQFANEVGDDCLVAKVNVDDNQNLAISYKVNSIPTVMIFENGVPTKTLVGVQSKNTLLTLVGK